MPLDGGPLRYFVASGYFGFDVLFIVSGFVLFLPASILIGVVSYRFLETPFRRLARRKRIEEERPDTRLAPVALASSSA